MMFKEQNSLNEILQGSKAVTQYIALNYKINLYFAELNLSICALKIIINIKQGKGKKKIN